MGDVDGLLGTVLVVDDDPVSRAFETAILRSADYEVVECETAEAALDLLLSHHDEIDVVLFDNHLPGITGATAVTHLRASPATRRLPVILLTSDGAVESRVAGLRAGADDYVVKPVSAEELVARVGARLRSGTAGGDLVERRRRRKELEELLAVGAFVPHFQPIVDLRDHTWPVIGVEALTRFDDGASVEARFRSAQSVGLGQELERATLTDALRSAAAFDGDTWVSVNVSPTFLMTDGALPGLLETCDRHVVLEISEQEPVDDYVALGRLVRSFGPRVHLSVDDAGSGFASLRHILLLEPEFVKLDRTWIHRVETDPARQALIAGLVHFSTSTGCKLIAEGIETEAERSVVESIGVDYGQGYLLGVPATVS
ncbi:MAG TPA: EAL domain-containing protein [Acidimicrobiales bacterium]|jgi:EAL domain-containing protein (putative c-di-GMP-specific phosphodiesterase class I)/ActR/RegA family two-component response regulator|nr:EAL domain-containing protein [Acidimicrobiales bacterium]